jgi:hypothetical protein
VGNGLALSEEQVTRLHDLELADTEHDAAAELVELAEEGVELLDLVVVVDVVLERVLQLALPRLVLALHRLLYVLQEHNLLVVGRTLLSQRLFRNRRQRRVHILSVILFRFLLLPASELVIDEFGLVVAVAETELADPVATLDPFVSAVLPEGSVH